MLRTTLVPLPVMVEGQRQAAALLQKLQNVEIREHTFAVAQQESVW